MKKKSKYTQNINTKKISVIPIVKWDTTNTQCK